RACLLILRSRFSVLRSSLLPTRSEAVAIQQRRAAGMNLAARVQSMRSATREVANRSASTDVDAGVVVAVAVELADETRAKRREHEVTALVHVHVVLRAVVVDRRLV